MAMTPQPNRPLTAEDVGLLKRGDVLRLNADYEWGFPEHAGGLTTVEDVGREDDTISLRTHEGLLDHFYPCTLAEVFVLVERPVATMTAAERAYGEEVADAMIVTPPSAEPNAGLEVIGWVKRINETHPIGLGQPSDWRFSPHRPTLEECLKAEWFDVQPLVTLQSATAALEAAEAQVAALREVVEKAAAYIEALGDNIERNDVDMHLDAVERPASFAQTLRAALPRGEG